MYITCASRLDSMSSAIGSGFNQRFSQSHVTPCSLLPGANMQAMEPDASSDAILSGELNDLLVVFNKISGY